MSMNKYKNKVYNKYIYTKILRLQNTFKTSVF